MIKTNRLIIRAIQLSDADDMYAYAKNPTIGKLAGWPVHTDIEHTISVIETLIKLGGVYAIIYENKMIGTIGIQQQEIGYALSEDYWHQGFMHEALKAILIYLFEKTETQSFTARTDVDNLKSQRVLLKLGFQQTKVENTFIGDQYRQLHHYILNKLDYERKQLPWQNTITNK